MAGFVFNMAQFQINNFFTKFFDNGCIEFITIQENPFCVDAITRKISPFLMVPIQNCNKIFSAEFASAKHLLCRVPFPVISVIDMASQ
jgi:hypothetical protein